MEQVTHIDSCILRAMVDEEDDARKRRLASHLLHANRGRPFRVSIIAIGEVFGKMAESSKMASCADSAIELRRLFHKDALELFGLGRDREIVDIADAILKRDLRLTPTDVMIVASAMTDPQCGRFVTLDHSLLESKVLDKIGRDRGIAIEDPGLVMKPSDSSCSMRTRSKEIGVRKASAAKLRSANMELEDAAASVDQHPLGSSISP